MTAGLNASTLDVALKEWDTVCRALGSARQMVLLRKGGIIEARRGFELQHEQFLLFPTFLHQKREMLKPEAHGDVQPMATEPDQVTVELAAHVSDVVRLASRAQMDAIDDQHVWMPPLIDMRFNYRPQNPLYLLIVRVYRLRGPATIRNTPEYAGCKSWVPLGQAIDVSGASPVMDDDRFEASRREIRTRAGSD